MNTQDLKQIEALLDKKLKGVAMKTDLQRFATKDDLQKLRGDIKLDLDDAIAHLVSSTDMSKADKSQVAIIEKRVTRIEKVLEL